MSDTQQAPEFGKAVNALATDQLRVMTDADFLLYSQAVVAILEACQQELERRATKGQPAGRA